VLELLRCLLTAKMLATAPLPATNKQVVLFNFHPSATNQVLKFLANIKLLQVVFSNYKNIATATFNILGTLHLRTEHQTRCIANVITPSRPSLCRIMLTLKVDNGQPKYEH
jgi:hypothetical protein